MFFNIFIRARLTGETSSTRPTAVSTIIMSDKRRRSDDTRRASTLCDKSGVYDDDTMELKVWCRKRIAMFHLCAMLIILS